MKKQNFKARLKGRVGAQPSTGAGRTIARLFPAAVASMLLLCAAATSAQNIELRLSVKIILDGNNRLPTNSFTFGASSFPLTSSQQVSNNIVYANTLLERNWRGYRFQLVEVVLLTNVAQWFNLPARSEANRDLLEFSAKTDPAAYAWRNNAVNIYINNTTSGICSFPGEHDIIFLGSDAYDTLIIHEVGHYFDLRHTHEGRGFWLNATFPCLSEDCDCPILTGGNDDGISDTIADHECWSRSDLASNNPGASQEEVDNVFLNIMSYHLPQDRFTSLQLDRWADAASTSREGVASGRSWFVASSGVCDFPAGRSRCLPLLIPVNGPFGAISSAVTSASPNGGDIIVLRPGNYNQTLTISKPVTLRATRAGWATIGKP